MLVISLDEYGQFEGNAAKRGVVGGVVFKCYGLREKNDERERIVDYLKKACQSCGASFPKDLHPCFESGKKIPQNSVALTRVKEYIRNTFAQFLAEAEPNGRYYLYSVVSEPEGVSMFEGEDAGNLLKDSYAGNRYLHMTQMAIRNLVINNLKLQDRVYSLDLATRVLNETATTAEQKAQARKLGLMKVREQNGDFSESYHLTDANSYISTLSAAIMEDEREDVEFTLSVQSIRYELNEGGNQFQAFMYLADIVCDLISASLKVQEGGTAQRLLNKLNEFTTHRDNMVWCYHDVDFKLRRAINYMLEGCWFPCLQLIHSIQSENSDQAKFYREHWIGILMEKLRQRKDHACITDAARQLALYMRKPNAPAEECQYIAEQLQELAKGEDEKHYGLCHYLLNSCLMTLCNHRGDDVQAECHYRMCEQYAANVPLDEYLELRNAYSVTLLDRQHYQKALENTKKTVELEVLADALKEQAFGMKGGISISHGRSLSQLGQCRAFLGQYEQAQACFLQALDAFQSSPVDMQITRSYLLHSYIESGEKTAYAKLAAVYFGSSNTKKQIEGVFRMEDTTFAFALLVYLKGWYRLYPNGFPTRITETLLTGIAEKGKGRMGHPWELIWKYVALLSANTMRKDLASTAQKNLRQMRDNSAGLLRQICLDSIESCKAGKETSNLPYMYR